MELENASFLNCIHDGNLMSDTKVLSLGSSAVSADGAAKKLSRSTGAPGPSSAGLSGTQPASLPDQSRRDNVKLGLSNTNISPLMHSSGELGVSSHDEIKDLRTASNAFSKNISGQKHKEMTNNLSEEDTAYDNNEFTKNKLHQRIDQSKESTQSEPLPYQSARSPMTSSDRSRKRVLTEVDKDILAILSEMDEPSISGIHHLTMDSITKEKYVGSEVATPFNIMKKIDKK